MSIYEMNIMPNYLRLLKNGTKTIEGRINKEKCKAINIDDLIVFHSTDNDEKGTFLVIGKKEYITIESMLKEEGIENMLPGITCINDGIKLYIVFRNLNIAFYISRKL